MALFWHKIVAKPGSGSTLRVAAKLNQSMSDWESASVFEDDEDDGDTSVGELYKHFFMAKRKNNQVPVTEMSSVRARLARTVRTHAFDLMMCFIILVHVGIIAYNADEVARNGSSPSWYRPLAWAFTIVYALEITTRIFVERCGFLGELLNFVDVAIVLLDLTCIIAISADGGNVWEEASKLNILRIIRLMRLVQIIRGLPLLRELWLMLHGLTSALRAGFWACVLIFIVLLIFSVVSVQFLRGPVAALEADVPWVFGMLLPPMCVYHDGIE